MSSSRNAEEFLQRFRRLRTEYKEKLAPLVAQVRNEYTAATGSAPSSGLEENLEAHLRVHFVNAFLEALNWNFDRAVFGNEPTMMPEAVVKSVLSGRRRYLDYLGFEADTHAPLLIVETKAPRSPLPRYVSQSEHRGDGGTVEELRLVLSEYLANGLKGASLIGEWNEWLKTLKDYVQSVYRESGRAPRCVLLTNGDWAFVFTNPANTFVEDRISVAEIVSLENAVALESAYRELFQLLAFQNLSDQIPPLSIGNLSFFVDRAIVAGVLHGLRLRYIEQAGIYSVGPVIRLAPVIFLKSKFDTWITVEDDSREYEIPHEGDDLRTHLDEILTVATNLLTEVNAKLRLDLVPGRLVEHYGNDEFFAALPGVRRSRGGDEFVIVTGDKTHYLLPEPSVPACPFHSWIESINRATAAGRQPVMMRSVAPRSFFKNEELHHCAHRVVDDAKHSRLTSQNKAQCGPRSGTFGQPFCEIAPFETRLCCRTCAFEEICTQAEAFHLPCMRPA